MGNSPSKDGIPLSRTTSSASLKSNKSSRSSRSRRGSSKHSTPNISRQNSGVNLPSQMDGLVLENETGGDTTPANTNLPPLMVQVEPKPPILLRRNTTGSLLVDLSGVEPGPEGTGLGLSRTLTNRSAASAQSIASEDEDGDEEQHNGDENHETGGISTATSAQDSSYISRLNSNLKVTTSIPSTPNSTSFDTDLRSLSKSRSNSSFSSGRILSKTNSNMLSKHSTNTTTIDIEDLIQRLLDSGYSGKRTKNVCLKNNEIQLVCAKAREILLSQPSFLELNPPVKVVGDVHGQFGDLIRIFTKCGFPPSSNYLFLGDYVDRGKQSLETILLLLCYKIKYPENFFLLRGNHECANVTRVYGFYDECKRRCNIKTWKLFIDTFNTLPIAATVAGKIFCVHGGLLPVLSSLDEIRNIVRPTDVPDFGLLNDLLWSDPADTLNEWEDNERGVSYVFSKVAINKFLQKFGFDLVCRAHMVVEDGYEFFNDQTLVTVFSAPNYCGEFDNWGAVMSVSEELLCTFELLDPLDSVALKQVMKKGKMERKQALQRAGQ